MRHPFVRRAAALLAASLLVLAACGDDDTSASPVTTAGDAVQTTTTDAGGATTTTDAGGGTTAETSAVSDATVVEITVADGEVTAPQRPKISLGDTVTLRVTSDVADEVHLHGYDLMVDVGAGGTAELAFDATIPGVFEVELENAGLKLVELEVS